MSTRRYRLQKIWRHFEDACGHRPATAREAIEWAIQRHLLQLPRVDPLDILARQMSSALREEYDTDEKGRRYRVNYAVRIGKRLSLWSNRDYAPHDHMEISFAQRRNGIVGDCIQLKTDVDSYNDFGEHANVQLILDFTEDVAEREFSLV